MGEEGEKLMLPVIISLTVIILIAAISFSINLMRYGYKIPHLSHQHDRPPIDVFFDECKKDADYLEALEELDELYPGSWGKEM